METNNLKNFTTVTQNTIVRNTDSTTPIVTYDQVAVELLGTSSLNKSYTSLETRLLQFVEKDGTKVLSDVNFSNELNAKLIGLNVDNELNANSTNPVQNKAICDEISDLRVEISDAEMSLEGLQSKVTELTGLDGTNFLGIFKDEAEILPTLDKSIGSAWFLVGDDLTSLELWTARVDPANDTWITCYWDDKQYDLSDFAKYNSRITALEEILEVSSVEGGAYISKTLTNVNYTIASNGQWTSNGTSGYIAVSTGDKIKITNTSANTGYYALLDNVANISEGVSSGATPTALAAGQSKEMEISSNGYLWVSKTLNDGTTPASEITPLSDDEESAPLEYETDIKVLKGNYINKSNSIQTNGRDYYKLAYIEPSTTTKYHIKATGFKTSSNEDVSIKYPQYASGKYSSLFQNASYVVVAIFDKGSNSVKTPVVTISDGSTSYDTDVEVQAGERLMFTYAPDGWELAPVVTQYGGQSGSGGGSSSGGSTIQQTIEVYKFEEGEFSTTNIFDKYQEKMDSATTLGYINGQPLKFGGNVTVFGGTSGGSSSGGGSQQIEITGGVALDSVDKLEAVASNPLRKIMREAGFGVMIKKWGFIGDSLTSGTVNSTAQAVYAGKDNAQNNFEYSWGQYLMHILGTSGYNFSYAGTRAKNWCLNTPIGNNSTSQGSALANRAWDKAKTDIKDAYIIAYGYNDATNTLYDGTKFYANGIGTTADIVADINTNPVDSFCGWYARIIQLLRSKNADCKIFVVTDPLHADISAAIREVAATFTKVYVIDLAQYATFYNNADFKARYFTGLHMNTAGYMYTAWVMNTYIDWIIRNNMDAFKLYVIDAK